MTLLPRRMGIDDFFDDLFENNIQLRTNETMKCDIYEKEGKYHLEMDTPGFNKEDIKIECENGYLTISAKKEQNKEDSSKKYIRKERVYSKYERSFYVGDINEKDIKATFKDGTLTVSFPSVEKKETKKSINID